MATDTSSAYIRSLNICIYGESLSHPTGVTSVFAACTVTLCQDLSLFLTDSVKIVLEAEIVSLTGTLLKKVASIRDCYEHICKLITKSQALAMIEYHLNKNKVRGYIRRRKRRLPKLWLVLGRSVQSF